MLQPKVSIVVPIYGVEAYLRKCLNSIAKQTFKDYEVICVDDVSPDGSASIVEEFVKRDPRFRLIRHRTNLGLGGARNTGIRAARAPLVMGIDSDDYIHKDMVVDLYQTITRSGCDIAECGYAEVDEKGTELSTYTPLREPLDISSETDIFASTRFAFWNKIFKTNLFHDNNIWFPDKLYYEDLATIPKLISQSKDIAYTPHVRYYYVQREGSITNAIKEKNILDYIKVFDIIIEYLRAVGLYDSQKDNLKRTIHVNFEFIRKKISMSADLYKMNLIRYCDMIETSYVSQIDNSHSLTLVEIPDAIKSTIDASPEAIDSKLYAESIQNIGKETFIVPIISRYDDTEAVMRLKLGALREHLVGRVTLPSFEPSIARADGLIINHLDTIEDRESDIRNFKARHKRLPVFAFVSDFYPRVSDQMRRFFDIIDFFIVPTVDMKNCMNCFTDKLIHVLPDPIDFCQTKPIERIHYHKNIIDVIWFGYSESFDKSMLQFSPLLEYYHSIRKIRYHIVTDTKNFKKPEHSMLHEYNSISFQHTLPMFDVCVLSHVPNDFQIATYIKSENKAVLSINSGVPILASRTPSYERLLTDLSQQDYLFNVRKELENGLFKLMDHNNRNAFLQNTQRKVVETYSSRVIAEKWLSLFEGALAY